MNRISFSICIYLLISLIWVYGAIASDAGKLEISMDFGSWKYARESRVLLASMTAQDSSGEMPVAGVIVDFYILTDTAEIKLGEAQTDMEGLAKLAIDPSVSLPKNDEGYITFIARFVGNGQYELSESELTIKDAWIDVSFFIEDSVKMIRYKGAVMDMEGTEIPLADDDIYLYVPRMFNLMPIEEGWLEEDGQGVMEFPPDLIGDSTGMITVIARIEDHYDYGNLEASAKIDWAIPKHAEKREGPQRELWTPIAPLWMIITLIIMLAGVWGHYIYAITQLYKIKKAAKNQ